MQGEKVTFGTSELPSLPPIGQEGKSSKEGSRTATSEAEKASSRCCFRSNVVTSDPRGRELADKRSRTATGSEKYAKERKVPSQPASSRSCFRSKCRNFRSNWKGRSGKKRSRRPRGRQQPPATRPHLGLLSPTSYAHSGFRLELWRKCALQAEFTEVCRFEVNLCGCRFQILRTLGGNSLPLLNCTCATSSDSDLFEAVFSSESAIVASGDSPVDSELSSRFTCSICDAMSGSVSSSLEKYRSSSELIAEITRHVSVGSNSSSGSSSSFILSLVMKSPSLIGHLAVWDGMFYHLLPLLVSGALLHQKKLEPLQVLKHLLHFVEYVDEYYQLLHCRLQVYPLFLRPGARGDLEDLRERCSQHAATPVDFRFLIWNEYLFDPRTAIEIEFFFSWGR
ncbi:hypothetical protein M5K25_003957 [Dendrobium thyrsiflorum]|uniref:Uncharacterized protein n=1 Tax=Dendrobium thyrsiflorum TaxID=117978 RepID=A0ABD0VKL7_DENTH